MGFVAVVRRTVEGWLDDGGPQLSAAIAYYAVLSLAPFLILTSALAGVAVDERAILALEDSLRLVLGSRGVEVALSIIENASLPERNYVAWAGNVLLLLVGATIVFANVQSALNRIWGLRWIGGGVVKGAIRQRLLAFAMIGITGLVMLFSLALTTVSGLMSTRLEDAVGGSLWVGLIDAGSSVLILGVLFAASFRLLPDGEIAWRDVLIGAFVTALLFVVGKLGVSAYLTRASVVGAYGVAGSLVFFLIWVYYSAAIFFLGAEFTHVWAIRQGRPIEPDPGAARVEQRIVEKEPDDDEKPRGG